MAQRASLLTGPFMRFEIAFPVGTHNQLLWFSVYACEAVCRGKAAVFISAAFIARAGCEPLRPSRALAFLLRRAGAPFPRASAKNRGPLQAVPVMARAMADRLGYVAPRQSKPLPDAGKVLRLAW